METLCWAGWREEAKKAVGSGMDKACVGPSPNAELMAALILLPGFKRLRLFLKETLRL